MLIACRTPIRRVVASAIITRCISNRENRCAYKREPLESLLTIPPASIICFLLTLIICLVQCSDWSTRGEQPELGNTCRKELHSASMPGMFYLRASQFTSIFRLQIHQVNHASRSIDCVTWERSMMKRTRDSVAQAKFQVLPKLDHTKPQFK